MSKGSRQAGTLPNQIDENRPGTLPTSAKWFCCEFARKIEYEAGRIEGRTRNWDRQKWRSLPAVRLLAVQAVFAEAVSSNTSANT